MGKKVFIVGNSRSGTTMMGRILGKNENIYTFHELHFFEQLWSPSDMNVTINQESAKKLFSRLLCIEREGYLSGCQDVSTYLNEAKTEIKNGMSKSNVFSNFLKYESKLHGKSISCDQTPRNLFYCKEILDLYPDAKIIYMVRDPRDVLLSQKNKWKRRFLGAKNIPLKEAFRAWINYHPITISKLWKASVNTMKAFENNKSVKKIYFEDLLKSPEEVVNSICEFIEISYNENMLHIPQIGSSTGNDKPELNGVNKSKTLGYRKGGLNNSELAVCESILKDTMTYHNYKIEGFKANKFALIYSYFTFPIKIIIALMLNIKRMKNILETIKRRIK